MSSTCQATQFNSTLVDKQRTPLLRAMQMDDLDAIMQIEPNLYTHPWSHGNFKDSLNSGYCGWVMVLNERIMAYAVVMFVLDEAHLLNISVDKAYHRQGYGRYLLEYIIAMSRQYKAKQLFLEVRVSNKHAIHLYIEVGLCEISIRKGYYPAAKGREDALLMAMAL